MRTVIAASILLFICHACKKPRFNDLGGSDTISGIAVFHDNSSNNATYTPLSGLTVYLRNIADTFSYLYSVKTNNTGHFSFNGINKSLNYRIDALYDKDGVHYGGKWYPGPNNPTRHAGNDTLLLQVDPGLQNGIHLTVQDELGGVIPFANVWVFNSPALFAADTSQGAAFNMPCNLYGIANKYAIAPGTYYFRVKVRSGGMELVDEQKATIGKTGINPITLTARSVPLQGFGNGLHILVHNVAGQPVNNATLFFYKNFETYVQDSVRHQNSLFQLTSNNNGHASAYVINPATYFVWARKVVAINDTLRNQAHTSFTVTNTIVPGSVTIE